MANSSTFTACSNPNGVLFRKKRYVLYALASLAIFIIPFIRIGDGHIFLLSFDHKQFHLLGTVFDTQEFYLLPFLSILLFLGIFFMTTLAGRVWCGWACPQTLFRVLYRDLLETKILGLRDKISNKQKEPDMSLWANKLKRAIAMAIWAVFVLIAAAGFLWYFVPPEDFFVYVFQEPREHPVLFVFWLGISTFLFFDITMLQEKFCFFICPYCRVQSVMYDKDTIMVVYDYQRGGAVYEGSKKLWKKPETPNAECTGCEACVRVCPTHIDIRKGMQLECINCLECADACTKVMGKLGKAPLIGWTSMNTVQTREKVKIFRFRTVAYMVALTAAFIGLLVIGGTKETMLLNINRTTELYTFNKSNGNIENAYAFLFHNTSSVPHTYTFELPDNPEIVIKRPKESLKLDAGEKSKQVVVLEATGNPNTTSENLIVPLRIRAFAEDAKDEVFVERESIFVYPPRSAP
ncbi:MAG: cytochrome c oxidase accessory protein CcoG [Helicobacter sp.]|nr:cytochrome c oxidase accessory protein CcoG [Helicobacter sp.]